MIPSRECFIPFSKYTTIDKLSLQTRPSLYIRLQDVFEGAPSWYYLRNMVIDTIKEMSPVSVPKFLGDKAL